MSMFNIFAEVDENKIQNVDQTKTVLNQLSNGTGILSTQMKKLSNFANGKRNMWMNELTMDKQKDLKLGGFTFSRIIVKELSDSYKGAILQNIVYEPLRDTRTFKFLINAGGIDGLKKRTLQEIRKKILKLAIGSSIPSTASAKLAGSKKNASTKRLARIFESKRTRPHTGFLSTASKTAACGKSSAAAPFAGRSGC